MEWKIKQEQQTTMKCKVSMVVYILKKQDKRDAIVKFVQKALYRTFIRCTTFYSTRLDFAQYRKPIPLLCILKHNFID